MSSTSGEKVNGRKTEDPALSSIFVFLFILSFDTSINYSQQCGLYHYILDCLAERMGLECLVYCVSMVYGCLV